MAPELRSRKAKGEFYAFSFHWRSRGKQVKQNLTLFLITAVAVEENPAPVKKSASVKAAKSPKTEKRKGIFLRFVVLSIKIFCL